MHQQFNTQQLYALPTLYLCVLYLSENKQRLVQLNHKLTGFYNWIEKCLLHGTNWVIKLNSMSFVFKSLIYTIFLRTVQEFRHNTSSICMSINLLKPTGYVMHQQFNIQQLYALPTLYLCVLYLSENKQRLVPRTA